MKKQLDCILVLFLLVVLAGCGTPGFPRQSYNPKKQIKQLEKEFNKTDLITEYYATNATETVKRDARDKMIDVRLALINLNYIQFIAQFSVTKESLDFGTEVTELGLNLATTAVGGAGTKTILAAIASGVTGSKLAIDKNFFFEKTVPVLITSMNAQRKVALAPILIGMTNSTHTYPLTQALSDIDAYYFAGTFIGALQAMQADAGAKEAQAEMNLQSIRFQEDPAAKLIRLWLFPNGPDNPDTNHVAQLKGWFTKQDFKAKPPQIEVFLEHPEYKSHRQKVVSEFIDPAIKPEEK
jgi:predicted small lipoprotein YifL